MNYYTISTYYATKYTAKTQITVLLNKIPQHFLIFVKIDIFRFHSLQNNQNMITN